MNDIKFETKKNKNKKQSSKKKTSTLHTNVVLFFSQKFVFLSMMFSWNFVRFEFLILSIKKLFVKHASKAKKSKSKKLTNITTTKKFDKNFSSFSSSVRKFRYNRTIIFSKRFWKKSTTFRIHVFFRFNEIRTRKRH